MQLPFLGEKSGAIAGTSATGSYGRQAGWQVVLGSQTTFSVFICVSGKKGLVTLT